MSRLKIDKAKPWARPTPDDLVILYDLKKLAQPAERNLMCLGREKPAE